MKEKLFSVTASDCRWDFYKGTGSGGQKKNKTENCCRCTHIASGAVATSESGRSKEHNKKQAFLKMSKTPVFISWIKAEILRKTGEAEDVEKKVENQLLNETFVQIESEDGWKTESSLQITPSDIREIR